MRTYSIRYEFYYFLLFLYRKYFIFHNLKLIFKKPSRVLNNIRGNQNNFLFGLFFIISEI